MGKLLQNYKETLTQVFSCENWEILRILILKNISERLLLPFLGFTKLKDIINPYNCLLKNNFSNKTTND